MATRKPRLDWIKEVLADPEEVGEPDPAVSPGIVSLRATESADLQPSIGRARAPEGDDRCPSWPLMRLTVARRS
jgi:hypothetical protein